MKRLTSSDWIYKTYTPNMYCQDMYMSLNKDTVFKTVEENILIKRKLMYLVSDENFVSNNSTALNAAYFIVIKGQSTRKI